MNDSDIQDFAHGIDRRKGNRRTEDYFWLTRMGDMSDQAVIVFDRDLKLDFFNEKTLERFEFTDGKFEKNITYADFVNRLARRGDFGAGDPETFCAIMEDVVVNQVANATSEPAIINTTSPSGKRLRINQSHGRDGRIIITATDLTDELQKQLALDTALQLGRAGYCYINFETKKTAFFGDHLSAKFDLDDFSWDTSGVFWDILHADDVDRVKSAWSMGLEEKSEWDIKIRAIDKSGASSWYHVFAHPELSPISGKLISFTIFFTDVTSIIKAQDQQLRARETAEKALKAKNAFLARLSHEIRTPMNAVIGIADALIHHHANPTINPKLELIQSSAEKIVQIVDETLDHSKLDADKFQLDPKLGNPARSVSNVCRLWEQQALKNGTTLTFQIGDNVPEKMVFDNHRYEQCLNNLLSNAVKFTKNGKIRVMLTRMETKGNKPQLVLAVQDTGIGISDDQMQQIFDPFTQADKSISRQYGGTGLGMNITKQLIELMGGKISVRSTINKGTVFALTLPIETRAPAVDEDSASDELVTQIFENVGPQQNEKYAGLNILVADDNATNHMVITSLLETVVGQIHVASDGQEAIKVLESTPIDIILMDIHMPVMDGIEATLTIRGSDADWKDVSIIALTADPQYQQKRLCRNIGMDDALAKPVKLSDILQAIDNTLEPRNIAQQQRITA